MRRMMFVAVAIFTAGTLTSCGGGKFAEWADAAVNTDVNASNLESQVDNGSMMVSLTCVTWSKATEEQRTKSPAALAESATKAGYPSSADDALTWLDANCKG